MKQRPRVRVLFSMLFVAVLTQAQPELEWQHALGGAGDDNAFGIQQTADGGYIMAGSARSFEGDVSGNHGMEDVWVVKLDNSGNIQWQNALGGTG